MNNWVLQLAKREWSGTTRYWIIGWLIGSGICVLTHPFDTDQLRLVARAGYWLGTNAIALVIMFGIDRALGSRRDARFWPMALLASVIFTCLFSPILLVLNAQVFDAKPDWDVSTFMINFGIAVLVHACVWMAMAPRQKPDTRPSLNRFSKRLKHPAPVWALRAEDHYLNVITATGSQMILMRMSDAVAELSEIDGLQIHRSYWVARAGVASFTSTSVTLHTAETLPISRANAKAARAFFSDGLP